MRIVNETFGVGDNGAQMFGLLQIANCIETLDYSYVLGLRNSNNKKFPAGVCVGSSVFVCDNLAFIAEILFARKHTKNIYEDLPTLVSTTIGKLADKWTDQNKRIEAYKTTDLTNREAQCILMDVADAEVAPWTRVWDMYQEWKTPRHPEFKDRNLWSLFNAVTENLKPRKESKGTSLWTLPNRTTRLHTICDSKAGLVLTNPEIVTPVETVVVAE
jgi:hypothetical protein